MSSPNNVWAIVPLSMKGPVTVFQHRGLSPHQFTPMSGAHHTQRTPRLRSVCILYKWRGAAGVERSAASTITQCPNCEIIL